MIKTHIVPVFQTLLIFPLAFFGIALAAQDTTQMNISGFSENSQLQFVLGTAWALYLDGPIDSDAPKRLEAFILKNKVPARSWVILNSDGGSLLAGMRLGTIIRKNEFRTDVGERRSTSSRTFEYDVGSCYSACTLAYTGGTFRFLKNGSHFGIHRFAFSKPEEHSTDVAQIASASIVAYLRSMDIDPDFFTLSTRAGPAEIFEPPRQTLERVNVVTDGFQKPKWSIEMSPSGKGRLVGLV